MDELKKYIKIQHKFSAVSKWIIILISLMFVFFLMMAKKRQGASFSISIIFIYYGFFVIAFLSIAGFLMSLPAMMFLRVSRRNYYISSLCYCGLLAIGFGLLQNVLLFLEYKVLKIVSLEEMKTFGVLFKYNGKIFGMVELFIFTVVLIFTVLLSVNFASILNFKIGPKVWVTFFGVYALIFIRFINVHTILNINMNIWSFTEICLGLSVVFSILGWKVIKSLSIRA